MAPTKKAPDHQPGHVLEARSGGYLVRSRTTEGAYWLVYGNTCTCPAGRKTQVGSCWHRRQVAEFCRLLDAELARPSAPPHVSALVD